jgi:hypothetical protein
MDREQRERQEAWELEWRRQVAFHEAGHAVAAVRQGRSFVEVNVIPVEHRGLDEGRSGCLDGPRPPRPENDPQDLEEYLVLLLAGAAAEVRSRPWYPTGSVYEQIWAQRLVRRAYADPEERRACYRRSQESARSLVDDYWPAVKALALELMRRPSIEAAEVRTIVARAMRPTVQPRPSSSAEAVYHPFRRGESSPPTDLQTLRKRCEEQQGQSWCVCRYCAQWQALRRSALGDRLNGR